jgi:hypothetical protein
MMEGAEGRRGWRLDTRCNAKVVALGVREVGDGRHEESDLGSGVKSKVCGGLAELRFSRILG